MNTTDSLHTTRWNYTTHLYLLSHGAYKPAEHEANIDYAAAHHFQATRINIWWNEIYPTPESTRNGDNWRHLDHYVNYAIGKGLKVIITVSLRHNEENGFMFGDADRVVDRNGKLDGCWMHNTRMSYSSPKAGLMLDFFRQVAERYKAQHNAGHILCLSPLVTREAEIAYAHDIMEDYNPYFLAEFRGWIEQRYERNLAALNRAWDSALTSFADVAPPPSLGCRAGFDWYLFRDLKARQFIDSCGEALRTIPGVTTPYRLLLDYGNVGDPMCVWRGSINFPLHASHPLVWGLKHNDAHDYDQAYTGSLLGSNAARLGKVAFNEYFFHREAKDYPGKDIINDSVREIRGHYEQGMNGVSYVGAVATNAPMEIIIKRLQDEGVWTGPIVPRDTSCTVRAKVTEMICQSGWGIKQKFFDPYFKPERPQVNLLIEDDLPASPLPVIKPIPFAG